MTASCFDAPPGRAGTASYKWDKYPAGTLPFWVADMDFASPPAVIAALKARAAHGVYGYTRIPESLTQAICAHLAGRYRWQVDPEWLVFLPGIGPGLNLACRAFTADDEAVMTVTPVYPPILGAPARQGRRLLAVPAVLENGRWRLPLEALEAAVTPQTRLFIFCHPHNPLGRAWERDELKAVTDLCHRHDLVLCSDEIHADLVLDAVPHVPAVVADPALVERSITFMAPSKTFNLPGLQIGFAVIPGAELRRRFRAVADTAMDLDLAGCFAVVGAEAAYREGGEWLAELLDYLRGNRDLVERFVAASLPGATMTHVEATYLAWLDVRGLGLADPARACLDAGVALSDGAAFDGPGYLRFNFACPRPTLQEGLERLQTAFG